VLDYLLALPPEHKAVVIGCHRDLLLDQLADALWARGRLLVEHNGDCSARAAATVRAFQTRPEVQFFVGQLSVSNLSLTLTAAAHVVFAEIPQTRADLDQALDRVHRFGQERECTATVFALDWESAGDEELLDALAHWKEVSDAVLDGREGGAAWNWADGNAENSPGGSTTSASRAGTSASCSACGARAEEVNEEVRRAEPPPVLRSEKDE
jgi:hypothetical protein